MGVAFPTWGTTRKARGRFPVPASGRKWTQGNESEWLSIAGGPGDDAAAATADFEVPETGEWQLWVRYRD